VAQNDDVTRAAALEASPNTSDFNSEATVVKPLLELPVFPS